MNTNSIPTTDKDYLLLNTIEGNSYVSQREISCRTGLSLGAVNLLLKKMIRDGLVKMETVPANRVIYILTPKGIAEKSEKTVRYLQHHYQIILQSKEHIRYKLDQHRQNYTSIVVCLPQGELKELVKQTIREYHHTQPEANVMMLENGRLDKLKAHVNSTIILYFPESSANLIMTIKQSGYATDVLI